MPAKSAGLVRRIISAVRVISHRVWQVFLDYWWYLRHALPFPNWLRHVLQTKIKRSGSTSHDSFFSGIFSAISQNGPHLHNSLQDYSRRTNNFAGIDNLSAANRRRIQPQRLLIVFLPGIYEGISYFRELRRNLYDYEIIEIGQLRRMDLPVAQLAKIVISQLQKIEQPIILLAHSKGGLVGRAVLAANLPHIYGMVTFATPWNGSSRAAIFPPYHSMRSLLPNGSDTFSPWSAALEKEIAGKIISITPRWDFHVPEGSFLQDAVNIPLSQSGHFRPLYHADGISALRSALTQLKSRIPND